MNETDKLFSNLIQHQVIGRKNTHFENTESNESIPLRLDLFCHIR